MRRQISRFRPMGISDILDETVEIYRSNFVLLIGISAVAYIPFTLLSALIQAPSAGQMSDSPESPIESVLVLVAMLLLTSLVTGALTIAISERYLGRESSIGSAYSRIIKGGVFFRLLWAILVKYMIIGLPPILLVGIAGMAAAGAMFGPGTTLVQTIIFVVLVGSCALAITAYLLTRMALVEPAFILEQGKAGYSIGRSWSLVKGSTLKAFGLLLIVGIVVVVVTYLVTGPTMAMMIIKEAAGQPVSPVIYVINMILTGIMSVLTAPVMSIASILLYYDLRIRKEGFDLELLAQELDAKARQFTREGAAGLAQEQLPETPPEERPVQET